MNEVTEKQNIFKPEPVKLNLDGDEYALYYDLNAFCEMEKIYSSVDSVLQMLLGTDTKPDLNMVTYCDAPCLADDIKIAGIPLSEYIGRLDTAREAKHSDTLNLLWIGCLHDHTVYDDDGNPTKYTISKAQLGAKVTFRNLREVNAKIVAALLRDLIPAVDEAAGKNGDQVETPILKTLDQE